VILTWFGRAFIYLASVSFIVGVVDQLRAIIRHQKARTLWWAILGLLGIAGAVGVMQFALITHNFTLLYVEQNNAVFTPLLYSITGMWSALEGSILLWALLLSALVVTVVIRFRRQVADPVVAWASTVLFVVAGFFALLMAGPADPFVPNPAFAGATGAGPNALLQDNPLVAAHPPLLYLGFVGFTVPYAFALAMLITGRVGDRWPNEVRRWSVLAWGCLTVGIVLGAWWSYQVLGWGGFWGWDPVENAALLPWLTGTAYLHSVVVQDRRGLFRIWNLSLAAVTFSLTILGTFFTRSGVLQSVHAFSSSTLGPVLIAAFAVSLGVPLLLLIARGDQLRSPVGVDEPFSREGLFVANNIIFVGFAIVVLLGTVFPLLYQAINGQEVTVGSPYFAAVGEPAAIVLLVLMAIAPLVSWRRADRHVLWRRLRPVAWVALAVVVGLVLGGVRKPLVLGAYFLAAAAAVTAVRTAALQVTAAWRRSKRLATVLTAPSLGGMVVHVGVVLMAVGIVTATSFATRDSVSLAPEQSTVVAGQTITFDGIKTFSTSLDTGTEIVVTVDHDDTLTPAVTNYRGRAGQIVGTPAIDSNLLRDVYLTFDAIGGGSTSGPQVDNALPKNSVVVGVTVEPLIAWLWIGGLLVAAGAALSLWRRPASAGSAS
jgi:cytochrome c-type biogenesis protein CcmF